MPGGWPKSRDVRQLTESRARFEFDIPVAELPGVSSELSAAAPLHVRLDFGREQGVGVVQVAVRGSLGATCQRCMRPLALQLDTDSRVALVTSEAEAAALPEAWETFLAADGVLDFPALIAEEVLLALPIVPLHDAGACSAAPPPPPGGNAQEPAATTRPFADLKALLEGGAPGGRDGNGQS